MIFSGGSGDPPSFAQNAKEGRGPALFEPECSLYVYFAEQAPLPHEVRPRPRSSAGEQECSPYTGLSLCYTHLAEDVDFGRFREAENIAVVGLGSADCAVSRGVAWMRCVQQFGERAMDGEADWVLCGFDGGESEPAYGGESGGYFAIWCFGIGIRVGSGMAGGRGAANVGGRIAEVRNALRR